VHLHRSALDPGAGADAAGGRRDVGPLDHGPLVDVRGGRALGLGDGGADGGGHRGDADERGGDGEDSEQGHGGQALKDEPGSAADVGWSDRVCPLGDYGRLEMTLRRTGAEGGGFVGEADAVYALLLMSLSQHRAVKVIV